MEKPYKDLFEPEKLSKVPLITLCNWQSKSLHFCDVRILQSLLLVKKILPKSYLGSQKSVEI